MIWITAFAIVEKGIRNTMTDEKIIKAFDCCVDGKCKSCPFHDECERNPFAMTLAVYGKTLIQRHKADIERLSVEIEILTNRIEQQNEQIAELVDDLKTVRVDAVREFSERVKAHTGHLPSSVYFGKIIDELVEMTRGKQ